MHSNQTNPVAAPERGAPRSPARLPELLAPAGDWECAKAAVENGADAIYFGLEKFNARMRANNFTEADLPRLMEFLHRRGVKSVERDLIQLHRRRCPGEAEPQPLAQHLFVGRPRQVQFRFR